MSDPTESIRREMIATGQPHADLAAELGIDGPIWTTETVSADFEITGFMAPFVVLHAVAGRLVGGSASGLWFYLIGTYAMALLYSLYYAFKRQDGLWYHGMTFVALYMGVLVFQTYWGILTMRDTRWGTRASTVDHKPVDQTRVTALSPDPGRIAA